MFKNYLKEGTRIYHVRRNIDETDVDVDDNPHPKGGITVVAITDKYKEDLITSFGVSRCNNKDSYNKKLGRELATNRAKLDPTLIMRKPLSPSHAHLIALSLGHEYSTLKE